MNIVEYLKNQPEGRRDHFLSVFKSMELESSPKLLRQCSDRVDNLRKRIKHSREREAHLKDLLSDVSSAMRELEGSDVVQEDIEQLKDWRDELCEMLDNINYKEIEEKVRKIVKIEERVRARSPFLSKIRTEFSDDFK